MTTSYSNCSFEGCVRRAKTKGYCGTHYNQKWRTGVMWAIPEKRQRPTTEVMEQQCLQDDCIGERHSRGLCKFHYEKARREGWLETVAIDSVFNQNKGNDCLSEDCEELAHCRGLCKRCYWTLRYFELGGRDIDANRKLQDIGWTLADYRTVGEQQGWLCAACDEPETAKNHKQEGSTKQLCADHDHQTGERRGLLCGRCNSALGLLGDDMDKIIGLAAYLASYQRGEIKAI